MSTLRKMKRSMGKGDPSPSVNLRLVDELAYNRGYDDGAKDQRQSDINHLIEILDGLENMPGIGKATANKIRYLIANKFGDKNCD